MEAEQEERLGVYKDERTKPANICQMDKNRDRSGKVFCRGSRTGNAKYPVWAILIEKGDVKIHIPLISGNRELRAVMEWLGCVI